MNYEPFQNLLKLSDTLKKCEEEDEDIDPEFRKDRDGLENMEE